MENTICIQNCDRHSTLSLQPEWLGEIVQPSACKPAVAPSKLIQSALDHPIGSLRLEQIAKRGQLIAILVDDHTRKTPAALLLPYVLDRLHTARIPDDDIRIVIALGSHRTMNELELTAKLGEEIVSRYEIVNISAADSSAMDLLGNTQRGIPAWVNRYAVQADLRIGLGMITPHMDAGFSGGAKIVLPGVCSEVTVDVFHSRPPAGRWTDTAINPLGNIDAPLRLDLEQFVSEKLPLDFILNVILTLDGEVYQCVAGDHITAHRAGVSSARQIYGAPAKRRYPIVLAYCHPYDHDLWQSMKGLWCGDLLTADGGELILITRSLEGYQQYPSLPEYIGTPAERLVQRLETGKINDPKEAATGLMVAAMKQRYYISLVSDGLSQSDANLMGVGYSESVQDAVDRAIRRLPEQDRKNSVGVIPDAGIVLPLVNHNP